MAKEKAQLLKSHQILKGNYDLMQVAYTQAMDRLKQDLDESELIEASKLGKVGSNNSKELAKGLDEIKRLKTEIVTIKEIANGKEQAYID